MCCALTFSLCSAFSIRDRTTMASRYSPGSPSPTKQSSKVIYRRWSTTCGAMASSLHQIISVSSRLAPSRSTRHPMSHSSWAISTLVQQRVHRKKQGAPSANRSHRQWWCARLVSWLCCSPCNAIVVVWAMRASIDTYFNEYDTNVAPRMLKRTHTVPPGTSLG